MLKKFFLVALFSFLIIASFLSLDLLNSHSSKINKSQYLIVKNIESRLELPPSASVSGNTQVCINSSPNPEITFTGSGGNAPYTFTYTINNGANQTISTVGNNNSVSISVSTNTVGEFVYKLVSVIDDDNETSTENGTATVVVSEPSVDFTFTNNGACSDTSVNFTSNITGNGPYTYSWNFGDGETSSSSNPSHVFESLGCATQLYSVVLTVTDDYGCSNSVTKQVSVRQKPNLSFYDVTARQNFTAQFDNCGNNTTDPSYTVTVGNESSSTSCISSYNIDWGDGSPIETGVTFPATHTYSQLGSFNMEITGLGTDCDNTVTYLIKNSSNPTGAIVNPGNTVNLCIPVAPIEFAIGSWGSNPPDTFYFVNYGDGTVETYTQADLESSVYYNASDPSSSQNFPIPHTYTESNCPNSSYTVYLDIITSCGASNLTAGPIIILKQPEVSFDTPDNGCQNIAIQFDNTTVQGYNQNCNTDEGFFWDFGDGNTSTLRDPQHTYTASGTYTVSLYAQNFCGTTETVTKDICIEPELTASFTLDSNNGCSTLSVQTTNTTDLSESCGDETYLWEVSYTSGFCGTIPEVWNFTNGTDEISAAPSIDFVTAGTYTLTLTTTNSCGSSMASEIIEVKQPPSVAINPIADFCGSATFVPTSTVDNCAPNTEIVTYNWSFPGGSPASTNTLDPGTITYNTPGDYQVTFSVTTSCGTTTDTEDFTIHEIPVITNTNLTQTICSGTETDEVNLTSTLSGTTYTWTATAPAGVSGYTTSGNTDTIPIQTIFNSNTTSEDVTFVITPTVGNCSGTPVNLVITVDPAPEFINHPLSESICDGGTITPLSVSVNGPGTPTYQWYRNTVNDNSSGTAISGETNATFTPLNSPVGVTYYYVIASFTSGAGCNEIVSNVAQIEIVSGIQIDGEPISTQNICVDGIVNTSLNAIHSGGTGTVSYQWYSNTTSSNMGGTAISGATSISYTPPAFSVPGNYYFYVEISINGSGCGVVTSEVSEVIVVNDPTISTQPIVSQELCQGTTPQDLEVIPSGGIGSTYSYQWYSNTVNSNVGGTPISGTTNSTFTPPTNTVGTFYYYIVVTQPDPGCSVISNVSELIVNPAPNFTSQPISETICFGNTFNTLTVSYSDGVGTPTYQWYSNTINDNTSGTAISGATNPNYTPPSATVGTVYYYAIITFSSGGCTQITSLVSENTVDDTPGISDKSDIICSGNPFNIIPDNSGGDNTPAGTTYTWTNPVVNPSGTITGASQETVPQATISQTLTNTTTNPATVTYTVTPVSGICTGLDFEVIITVNPSISITQSVANSTCYLGNNGSIEIEISGGVPFTTGTPYQITWNGPNGYTSSDEDIFNLAPGNYSLTLIDDGGCPFTQAFTITEPDELIFNSVDFDPETISCFGANDGSIGIDISGGTPPYQYSWTRDGLAYNTSEDISNLGSGDYEVTVTDANNCPPIIQNFLIVEPDELDISLVNQLDVICFGDATGEINVSVTGGRLFEISSGVFDYNYNWTGPNGFTSTNQNLTGLIAGTYTLTVTDRSNCTDTLEVILNQTDEIIIDYTATEIECYGNNNASITINNISGGNAPYSVSWSNFGSGMTQTNLSPGTYVITVTDNTNCVKQATIVIDDAPLFRITPQVEHVSCFGANDARIVLNLEGGIDPVNLVWDDDPTAGVERNNIGPGTYTVTITDGQPCEIIETFEITEPTELMLSGNSQDALDCDDANSGNINLIVTGGTLPLSYYWSNGAASEDLNNIPPGNYTVNVIDANGCEVSGEFIINRFVPIEIDVDVVTDLNCETRVVNQSFVAQPSGGVPPYQILWSSGTISGANNEVMETSISGLVLLEVTDSVGCTSSISYNVDIPELGDANFNINSQMYDTYGFYSIQDPIQFTNTSYGDYVSVSWDFGDGTFSQEENPKHIYNTVGTYTVTQTVIYPFDCVYTQTIIVNVELGYKIIIPNAFTPNDDTLNDNFMPSVLALNNLEFNIYDTWGSLIHSEKGDSLKGWNGQIKDTNAENGNYYYTFSGDTFYGETITSKGAFVLIK
ncbi:PKD domain-containing protein [Seonamhaeicola sediminis]|uniref:PKD domain-containing protein n=1 Tax=Seonamhaeicola sediminis TaxID=2528206 RepID=A0A562YEL0_9FLAO|nr:PKD domain-containing protein [Seonamhaeicola sediminis]TWO32959.1 PKD domain-containing protein [Seonamhaeicola sediminis]